MAELAGRQLPVGLDIFTPVDAGLEDLLDPVMADSTGAGDVLCVGHRARIVRRKFGMRTMAVGAGRRHDETGLSKRYCASWDPKLKVEAEPRSRVVLKHLGEELAYRVTGLDGHAKDVPYEAL